MEEERILVVDDEEPILDMVTRMVKLMGYDAKVARDGVAALEILREEPITILITDMKMPLMDGFELMKRVKSEFPDINIISMTGHSASYSYTDVVMAGATDYITKPFTFDEVRAKLNRVVRERRLINDLTKKSIELERANEELKRLSNLKSIFVSSVSHELRTPLTVIKEFISLLLEGHGGSLTEDQQEYLSIAHKNIIRLTNLIDTLLDFSRIESGKGIKLKFEPVRLIGVVEDACMTLSQQLEEKRITLESRIDPETPLVLVDRNRLVEVFINLIGNGIKFTPQGGNITIDTRGLTDRRNYLRVVVSDTGVGISPEDLPRIFDRFFQGKKTQAGITTGTGLGLAITKEIIEGHQGSIHAESRPGVGSSFIFTIPLLEVNNLFNLIIQPMIEEAEKEKLSFSLIRVGFWDQKTKRDVTLSHESWEGVIYALQKMVRSIDVVIPFENNMVYIFSFNDDKMALEIGERIVVKLTKGGYIPKGIDVKFKTYSYPQEARTIEEFLKGCRSLIKSD